jgi:hypothetical protein
LREQRFGESPARNSFPRLREQKVERYLKLAIGLFEVALALGALIIAIYLLSRL